MACDHLYNTGNSDVLPVTDTIEEIPFAAIGSPNYLNIIEGDVMA